MLQILDTKMKSNNNEEKNSLSVTLPNLTLIPHPYKLKIDLIDRLTSYFQRFQVENFVFHIILSSKRALVTH